MENNSKILFYGYGNPGRQDDALGISFVDEMQKWVKAQKIENIDFDSNYQLNIEDAEVISNYDVVIFADASMEPIDSFDFSEVEPDDAQVEFTMHAVSVSFVVDLCQKMYGKAPKAYLVHIKGYEWELDFDKRLSAKAEENLREALKFMKGKLQDLQ
ncbi:MAG: hydrogenase maturation protease [Candidatus Cloacimonetes bacterium]|nr:hydrogenase maturation protease [Candidatus Cloacimonadota bacterium]MCF7814535.1 hydrogenase maturation protease [Candidatus Cloacimonadota bacterium]MCF7867673.1 hydrogenase maturation protease [Candidatus Cloacimonadota bacterium]MCF7883529.1 hydrogenase maturation protease [Candidatus Cloacimonadota bacterium]